MKNQKWDDLNRNGTSEERLKMFLNSKFDAFAILQLRYDNPEITAVERFESLRGLKQQGKQPDISHYEVVYAAPISFYKDVNIMLDEIYEKFNIDCPKDFRGRSLSVSDVVAIRHKGNVSCHYVDSVGFKELPGFIQEEKYQKSTHVISKNDYEMSRGIIHNEEDDSEKEDMKTRQSVLKELRDKKLQKNYVDKRKGTKERDIGRS